MDAAAGIALILFLLVAYFVPTIVALIRGKSNAGAIFVLNLLLGWSLIGWVVALVWAVSNQAVDRTHQIGEVRCRQCGRLGQWALGQCASCGHVYGSP